MEICPVMLTDAQEIDCLLQGLTKPHVIAAIATNRPLKIRDFISRRGLVKRGNILAWLKHLEHAPLYVASGVRIDWSRLGVFDDDDAAVCEGERAQGGDDADDIETVSENINLDDPVQLAIALNAMSKTIFFNKESEQRPRALLMRDDGERSGELDDAAAADKLIDQSHSLHLAPGENRVPLALFMDAYAEELAFPTIYMGGPRKIIGPRSTPFAMASNEIRRTDRRGATPEHVLYMAAKVMRYNVSESNMMFRTNETTGFITREQFENGGKKFLEEMLDRDLAFMWGVPNTVQYWQDRRSELFAMIRQLGKPHAFLTMSASEVHWERLLETLQRLRVGPDGTPRPVSEMMAWEGVELVNEDPVACAMYINRIFDVIMNVLADRNCSPLRPYVIRDYFKRVEFQQRGSAHVHVILWLEEAPDEELTGEEGAMPKTLEMVAQLLTLDTTLLRRPRTQTHQHTHTCYKRGRTKCPFGAPFMPSDETRIVVPFPPAPEGDDAESERERQRLKALKKKYDEMHEGSSPATLRISPRFYALLACTPRRSI
ncbi:hypothetical protein MRX96_000996 [Rhipicephalus microplus]